MRIAVSGACVVAATSAAIPTSAKYAGEVPGNQPKECTIKPIQPPVAAPMSKEGANNPPAPPEPTVTLVAISLTSASIIKPETNGIASCNFPVSLFAK